MFARSAPIARENDAMSDTRGQSGGRAEGGADGASVRVNGDPIDWPRAGSVADLLERLGLQGKRVAVSVNRSVIPRSRHAEAVVHAGDRIEILEAVGGG